MIGTTRDRQPDGGNDATSQITNGQAPNHRNSGELTLTLTRR